MQNISNGKVHSLVDQAITKEAIIVEEEKDGRMTRVMFKATTSKSLDILEQSLQGKKMVKAHC